MKNLEEKGANRLRQPAQQATVVLGFGRPAVRVVRANPVSEPRAVAGPQFSPDIPVGGPPPRFLQPAVKRRVRRDAPHTRPLPVTGSASPTGPTGLYAGLPGKRSVS